MAIRRKRASSDLPQAEINIVSLMDVLTTMLFFLIMFVSFANFSALKATALVKTPSTEDIKPVFTLKVLLESENSAVLNLGPTAGLHMQPGAWSSRFIGSDSAGYKAEAHGANKNLLFKDMQSLLKEIKQKFPLETKLVLEVKDHVGYQLFIDTMSSARSLSDTNQSFVVKNALGKEERTIVLFPEVIITEAGGT